MAPQTPNREVWQSHILAIFLVIAAAALRLWPLDALEFRLPYVTFYPAVMIAALYGGLTPGLLALSLSCFTVLFLWPAFVDKPFVQDFGDWLGLALFVTNCAVISGVAEAMRRARTRAKRVQFDLVSRNAELKAARDKLEERVQRRTSELVQATESLEGELTERKRAEEAMRQSEERYRAVFNNAGVGICVSDREGRFVQVNAASARMFGYTRDELGNLTFRDITHPDDLNASEKALLPLQRGEKDSYRLEKHYIRKDGQVICADVSVSALRNPKGEYTATLAVIVDITERKRAEESLRESEARIRTKLESILLPEGDIAALELADVIDVPTIQGLMSDFFSLTKIPVGLIDLKGKVLIGTGWQEICAKFRRLDPEMCQHCVRSETFVYEEVEQGSFGLCHCKHNMWNVATPIIVGGKHLGNLFLGQFFFDDEKPDYAALRRQARHYGFDEQEYLAALERVPRWSRETVDLAMTFYAKLGNILSTLSYSNIKLARLLTERERLVTAIEQAAETIVITDAEGAISYVNPAFERTTGYAREEAIGSNPRILKSGQQDEEFYKHLWGTLAAGDVWSGRIVNKKKDGTLFEEEASISPIKDESGRIVSYVAVKRDVTKEVSLHKQLLHAQKMEAMGTLAGGIAHDFNNLLQVTSGYTELLMQEKNKDDPEYADLSKIFQAARNGAELVQRLLTFSRKVEPKAVPLDLNQQILRVETLLRRTIPKMIEIRLDLSPDLARVQADPTQMEQVLMNLAVNARDAMPAGGKLIIETRNVAPDDEYCELSVGAKPEACVLLAVSDTGHGMEQETLDHIFEPFYTTKELGRGTGLGLAMVYGIVQQHGGYIRCESQVSRGTTFQVWLPALTTETEPEVEKSYVLPAVGTETILLVDDEQFVRELGARVLSKSGYTVMEAASGKEALQVFAREGSRISLVILDLIMPEMGGSECLREILKLESQARVLVSSGYSGDASIRECLAHGARGFVPKPFRFKELLEEVRRALDAE